MTDTCVIFTPRSRFAIAESFRRAHEGESTLTTPQQTSLGSLFILLFQCVLLLQGSRL